MNMIWSSKLYSMDCPGQCFLSVSADIFFVLCHCLFKKRLVEINHPLSIAELVKRLLCGCLTGCMQ